MSKSISIPFKNDPKNRAMYSTDMKSVTVHTYQNALYYFSAGTFLLGKSINYENQNVNFNDVSIVLFAFATELFFKALLYDNKIKFPNIHSLIKLYSLLPNEIQTEIKAKVEIKNDTEAFEVILDEISEAFDYYRYINEKIGACINMMFLCEFSFKVRNIL